MLMSILEHCKECIAKNITLISSESLDFPTFRQSLQISIWWYFCDIL